GRYGHPLVDNDHVARFQRLVGGHPFLAQRGLYELHQQKTDLAFLEQNADRDDGPFGDHLHRLLVSLSFDQELLEELRAFLLSGSTLSNGAFYRLRSAGVLSGESAVPRLRCELYA